MFFLKSFFTASGTGLEAFFTMEGVLVVAVCTKKDYVAVTLPEYALADSCWVSPNLSNKKKKFKSRKTLLNNYCYVWYFI